MAVSDDRNVVVGLEQSPAAGIDQPDSLAAHDVYGLVVRESGHERSERRLPPSHERRRPRRWRRRAKLTCDAIGADLVEKLDQRPRVVVPGLNVRRVFWIALDTPSADRDD